MRGGVTPRVRAAAFVLLAVQNAASALVVRLSHDHSRENGSRPFLSSSVVLVGEAGKLVLALALARETPRPSPRPGGGGGGRLAALLPSRTVFLFAPVAAIYAFQNNLFMAAARSLDPPTFQARCADFALNRVEGLRPVFRLSSAFSALPIRLRRAARLFWLL